MHLVAMQNIHKPRPSLAKRYTVVLWLVLIGWDLAPIQTPHVPCSTAMRPTLENAFMKRWNKHVASSVSVCLGSLVNCPACNVLS